jgi:hypothetical protein
VLAETEGPVVLVGQSYGDIVITEVGDTENAGSEPAGLIVRIRLADSITSKGSG